MRRSLLTLCLALLTDTAFGQSPASESWIDSPEAYFATAAERGEWQRLQSRVERDAFKERYWLKRDPTIGTPRNEFRDMVHARIKIADDRFPIREIPGSRTSRGMLFIVFGSPAYVKDRRQAPLEAPPPPTSTARQTIAGMVEGNETTSIWLWDRQRSPKVLDAVGLPQLEMIVIIEPARRRDRLQNPGLFHELREKLAKKSIVNADLIAAAREPLPTRSAPAILDLSTPQEFPEQVVAALENAPAAFRSTDGEVFGQALVWRADTPVSVFWFFLPESTTADARDLKFYGLINSSSGQEAVRIAKDVLPERSFLTSTPGHVAVARVALPPGSYSGHFAIFDSKTKTPVASARGKVIVPDSKTFALSPLILTGGANPVAPDTTGDFILGQTEVLPRADAIFLGSESIWYFFEVMNPKTDKPALEIRLRQGIAWVGKPKTVQTSLSRVAESRYLGALEMPLATLPPGDYSLYLTLKDGSEEAVGRADFRILAR